MKFLIRKKKSFGVECPEPSFTNRRSVSGMKKLLPLKLSSPSLPDSSLSQLTGSTNRSSSATSESLTLHSHLPTTKNLSDPRFKKPRSPRLILRPEQYRDVPIYTELGSPVIGLPYYNCEDDYCDCSAPNSEACNIQNKYSLNDEISYFGDRNVSSLEDLDERRNLPTTTKVKDWSRTSDMSLKCLGEVLFHDEASWLSSPLQKGNRPRLDCTLDVLSHKAPIEHDIEDWLSESTNSSFFESEQDTQVSSGRIVEDLTDNPRLE